MATAHARKIAPETAATEDASLSAVAGLLGLKKAPATALAAHDLIDAGLPSRALTHLVDQLQVLPQEYSLEAAVGMSLRTFQRRKDARPLSREQSGRAWKFAEILARATSILGSQHEAEQWLDRPAIGLGSRKPIELLSTPTGVEMVETYLGRLEYGVYT